MDHDLGCAAPPNWCPYDLSFVEPWVEEVAAGRLPQGRVSFAAWSQGWAYMAVARLPKRLRKPGTLRLRLSVDIRCGKFCIGVQTPDQSDFYKQMVIAELGRHDVELAIDCSDAPGDIIFRHGSSEEGETAFTLQSLEFAVSQHIQGPLRPDAPHPIFEEFSRWSGLSAPGFYANWLGTKTSAEVLPNASNQSQTVRPTMPQMPKVDEEYFEWISLLEAVKMADQNFTMVELGAGWGRWLVDGWNALRRIGKDIPVTLVGVEAEAQHFRWMLEHFRNNDLNPNEHRLIEAAVAAQSGTVHFATGHSTSWYGQAIVRPEWRSSEYPDAAPAAVRAVSLADAIEGLPMIDLIDMDVQGAEAEVVGASHDLLQACVKRIHIGTHGDAIEASLRESFNGMGWTCLADYPNQQTVDTPFGLISFGDGVQSWVNPRFL